ncbi:GNAT family N-acetyltransferase [Actinomadura graeca]|uniref:GNAT family N-acetyltransferase n=1 Tax=Actinomadura graeca TaxID=2750812 RepID=A0ABX8R024_9ACTN|nr:GNAT family N-acetyltransferase [Actinomadura graeca]QXJ23052.1 GNAT family N-acetyltransferase [Actinomadura graeca]
MSPRNAVLLSGHGLVLREWGDDDLEALVELFDDPDIAYWTPLVTPFDVAAARTYIARAREGRVRDERLHLAITTDGRRPLGEVMLNKVYGTIGYGVGAAHRGQGLASRAVLLMTEYALGAGGLARVSLEIEPGNAASVAVARAAGYRLTDVAPVVVEDKGRRVALLTWTHGPPDDDPAR